MLAEGGGKNEPFGEHDGDAPERGKGSKCKRKTCELWRVSLNSCERDAARREKRL